MDTLEQRLTADLTDAAEAAMNAGLTPPDRDAVTTAVATRQRHRRLRVTLAIAACILAAGGVLAALVGDDVTRTEMAPAHQDTTVGPTTTPPTSTSRSTTGSTDSTESTNTTTVDTTLGTGTTTLSVPPNDPEQPGPNAPGIVPITEEMVRTIAYPLDQGIGNLPAPCRSYWEDTSSGTPEENGLAADQNGIVIDEASITLADIDGDGAQDGMAAFTCETGGTMPPGGVLAVIAEPGGAGSYAIYPDTGTITARHEQQFGDPRTRFTGPFALVGEAGGMRDITVELDSYRQSDANAGASARAIARYRVAGNTLELVDVRQL